MARPSNAEKANAQVINEQSRLLLGEAVTELRNRLKVKDEKKRMADGNLIKLIGTLMDVLVDENTQTRTDVTMEMLAQKAVKVNLRIQKANRQALTEEAIDTQDATEEADDEQSIELSVETDDTSDSD